jgi:beta-glucosidase
VVAWLPGSEGNGVADVLMARLDGSAQNDFQGKLSFSWPKSVSQAVLNVGQKNYDPLFAYGYGLSYAKPQEVRNDFDESSARIASEILEESWMFVSREMSEYQFSLTDEGSEPVVVNGNREVSATDENLLLLSTDKVAQEDARRFKWKGLRPATASLAAKRPVDMSQYLGQQSALSFTMKVDQAPTAAVTLSMRCAGECKAPMDVSERLKSAPVGQYQDYKFGLACFVKKGASFNKLTNAFAMKSNGKLDVVIADIKIVPKVNPSEVLMCN